MRSFLLLLSIALWSSGCGPSTAPPGQHKNEPGAATMVGTYVETADGGTFTDCTTGELCPIVREGDYEALARAYASVSHAAAVPVIVSLVGRLRPLPVAEGSPPRDQLIVDHLLRVWPDETCEKAGVHTTLDNTYWKLVELNGKPVTTHEDQREVHMLLRADSGQVRGFAGCNDFLGSYEVNGSRLRIVGMSSAESVCAYIDEEKEFIATLPRVTNYQSLGESLDLRDQAGSVARLRAVYFR